MLERKNNYIVTLLVASLVSFGLVYANHQKAYAHEFSGDESASFIALIEAINADLQLAESNLASNVTLAQEHATHAVEDLDNQTVEEIAENNDRLSRDLPATLRDLQNSIADSSAQEIQTKVQNITSLLGETVSARIASDQMDNSTMRALSIVAMADEVVGYYGAAYGISPEEGEEEEESANVTGNDTEIIETTSTEGNTTQEEIVNSNMTTDVNATAGNQTIVSMADYQRAQALVTRTQQLFVEEVKPLAPANATEFIANVETGLERLKQAIDNKEPFTNVETIMANEVDANLNSAYNLE